MLRSIPSHDLRETFPRLDSLTSRPGTQVAPRQQVGYQRDFRFELIKLVHEPAIPRLIRRASVVRDKTC
jgi:hypothetical protein